MSRNLNWSASLADRIEEQYERAMAEFPQKKAEVEAWIAGRGCAGAGAGSREISAGAEDLAVCLKFLYAFLPAGDMIEYGVETIAGYAEATLEMYGEIAYAREVPPELFLTYVLSCRVNNENLDGSRRWLFEQLAPRVKGKTMTEAALEVNYWCYEKATYIPSDGRTLAPFGICRTAKGRCGEESTLAVSALRSVGIPARQCYVPRWAHCDDNHAWVEVWADGRWHYLGACEPEPVLDKGWFTAAASKAMLVHAKAYSHFLNGEREAARTPLYSLINSTETYGSCHTVSVTVTRDGRPAAGVPVSFELINYSELFELYRENTDAEGRASFLTGRGDLFLCASADGWFAGMRIDTRERTQVLLELTQGIRPEELKGTLEESFDLNPPVEILPEAPSSEKKREHEARLKECEAVRAAYEKTFVRESGISEKWDAYFANAKGNHEEFWRFYENPEFSLEDKELLLDTLRSKDFVDVTADVLASYLRQALPHQRAWTREIYQKYLLAPRIANEMLVDCRGKIVDILREKKVSLGTAAEVWAYLRDSLRLLPEYGGSSWSANAAGCLRYSVCTKSLLPVMFVQVCRALGLPARLDPVTGQPEAVLEKDGQAVFERVKQERKSSPAAETKADEKPAETAGRGRVCLTLQNPAEEPLEYMHHFTLGKYADGNYRTLHYWDLKVEREKELEIEPGSYRLITSVRQIDGGVSAWLKYFTVTADGCVTLNLREDRTAERLKYADLPEGTVRRLDPETGTVGAAVALSELYRGRKTILIFAEPGKEPTEHLLQEILECQEEYRKEGYLLILALLAPEGLENETLQSVLRTEIETVPVLCTDESFLYALHESFHVGDERLPFAAAINENGKGLFAFANYNIRTAWTLMKLFRSDHPAAPVSC